MGITGCYWQYRVATGAVVSEKQIVSEYQGFGDDRPKYTFYVETEDMGIQEFSFINGSSEVKRLDELLKPGDHVKILLQEQRNRRNFITFYSLDNVLEINGQLLVNDKEKYKVLVPNENVKKLVGK